MVVYDNDDQDDSRDMDPGIYALNEQRMFVSSGQNESEPSVTGSIDKKECSNYKRVESRFDIMSVLLRKLISAAVIFFMLVGFPLILRSCQHSRGESYGRERSQLIRSNFDREADSLDHLSATYVPELNEMDTMTPAYGTHPTQPIPSSTYPIPWRWTPEVELTLLDLSIIDMLERAVELILLYQDQGSTSNSVESRRLSSDSTASVNSDTSSRDLQVPIDDSGLMHPFDTRSQDTIRSNDTIISQEIVRARPPAPPFPLAPRERILPGSDEFNDFLTGRSSPLFHRRSTPSGRSSQDRKLVDRSLSRSLVRNSASGNVRTGCGSDLVPFSADFGQHPIPLQPGIRPISWKDALISIFKSEIRFRVKIIGRPQ